MSPERCGVASRLCKPKIRARLPSLPCGDRPVSGSGVCPCAGSLPAFHRYAKYYFELRQLAEKTNRTFSLTMLDKDGAKKLEVRLAGTAATRSDSLPRPGRSPLCRLPAPPHAGHVAADVGGRHPGKNPHLAQPGPPHVHRKGHPLVEGPARLCRPSPQKHSCCRGPARHCRPWGAAAVATLNAQGTAHCRPDRRARAVPGTPLPR